MQPRGCLTVYKRPRLPKHSRSNRYRIGFLERKTTDQEIERREKETLRVNERGCERDGREFAAVSQRREATNNPLPPTSNRTFPHFVVDNIVYKNTLNVKKLFRRWSGSVFQRLFNIARDSQTEIPLRFPTIDILFRNNVCIGTQRHQAAGNL